MNSYRESSCSSLIFSGKRDIGGRVDFFLLFLSRPSALKVFQMWPFVWKVCPPLSNPGLGMCLKENYSDSPSNEYSRHYSAESEYLRRQNMNQKSGEKQKKKNDHHVRRSHNFDSNNGYWAKEKDQNDNALILGRASINTRPSASNVVILGRVLGLDSAHPYPGCGEIHQGTIASEIKLALFNLWYF